MLYVIHFILNSLYFVARIFKKEVIVIMFCTRCVRNQKKYRLSFKSRRCEKCVRVEKKCESSMSLINFDDIDKAINKLSREETKMEIALKIANDMIRSKLFKLKRFRE